MTNTYLPWEGLLYFLKIKSNECDTIGNKNDRTLTIAFMNELFCGDMPRQWMLICAQLAVLESALLGNVCVARNPYGTLSVVGPAFVNREVILKATPYFPWGCDVEWRYIMNGTTIFQTINGTDKTYSEDGSFFLKWNASIEYNRTEIYAVCLTNATIGTPLITLNMKAIDGHCGALMILSPVARGTEVKVGYFPSDQSIRGQTFTKRTWKKDMHEFQLQKGSYEEKLFSEYLYILTILNFTQNDEGTYSLYCNSSGNTGSVQLHISERPSYPVLGPKFSDFNTTECIYVYVGSDLYCKTENGTEPVQVSLLIGNDSFVLAESEQNKGFYLFSNVQQKMAGLSRLNVTCQVSNAALETPYEVHGVLCNVEKGSLPVLTVPEQLHGERSSSICEVRNALPAPAIEIRVDKVLQANVQQIDLFDGSSHTFTSTATMTKTNTTWNGQQMCCTLKRKFGLENVSECKNISMKCDPTLNLNKTSPVDLPPNKTLVVKCTVNDCNAEGLWTLKWEDKHNSIIKTCNKTEECLLTLNYTGDGKKTYTCRAWKSLFTLNISLTVSSSMSDVSQPHEKDNQTFSSTSRFPLNNILIGTGVLCGLCILFIIGRCVYLKRRKVNEINTIEIVENHRDTSLDNGVLHIETGGVQYAVMQRQAATQRTGTQQPHAGGGLTYAELDIKFLQEATARVPPRKNNTPTEYADIAFSSTQKSAEEDHVYHNTSA
ncbi:uncharacterized protein LOC128236102 isoform X2 [Mya arenaria]|uniref:uncharacterized protein LOC128236102 isoform X2 n=1 Tax=Mya arenaria TaxID=6604 RepID=UPI0022E23041|nr:uncharacterized protein LOC128236102 isoform X2 [Mya arenaria]